MPVKLLIVDDQEIVRKSLSLLFETQDEIEVVGFAESGEEAVERNAELNPDVILMDLRMPGMGGIEATRKIHLDRPLTRIIILTALRDLDWLQKSIEAGASHLVRKDISMAALVDLIMGQTTLSHA